LHASRAFEDFPARGGHARDTAGSRPMCPPIPPRALLSHPAEGCCFGTLSSTNLPLFVAPALLHDRGAALAAHAHALDVHAHDVGGPGPHIDILSPRRPTLRARLSHIHETGALHWCLLGMAALAADETASRQATKADVDRWMKDLPTGPVRTKRPDGYGQPDHGREARKAALIMPLE
jgi:hypothetical protein